MAVGSWDDVAGLAGARTTIIDLGGATVMPSFHDPHLHLLSYARQRARVDCRGALSPEDLVDRISARNSAAPDGRWIRAAGFDDATFQHSELPDRLLLDRASRRRPVRLQHRSLHLDILNTRALKVSGLWSSDDPGIERNRLNGEPTGRLFHASELLRHRLPRPTFDELARDVRLVCDEMAADGLTTIQDASVTNGPEEWELFHRLAQGGHLGGLRLCVMPGAQHWREVLAARPPSDTVRIGPVKLMLGEGNAESGEVRLITSEAHVAGRSVAIHAVSEAELVMALNALGPDSAGSMRGGRDRIEHGAIIPDELLEDVRSTGATVVGSPGLIHDRGDVYRAEIEAELHSWMHRAASLVQNGIPYAIASDAPVLEPIPLRHLAVARSRLTKSGEVLGPGEALTTEQALRAMTIDAARTVGADHELGMLRPGYLADIVVVDGDTLDVGDPDARIRPVRLTIGGGRVLWRREDAV
ncbi:MAG TPA: amidohydrolase family protein [Chloroflexota bacterium]|nr:amidohydrolase family protein [Chloroflexota bacterium]